MNESDIKRLAEITKSLGGLSSELVTIVERNAGSFRWQIRGLLAAHEAVAGAVGIVNEVRESAEMEKL